MLNRPILEGKSGDGTTSGVTAIQDTSAHMNELKANAEINKEGTTTGSSTGSSVIQPAPSTAEGVSADIAVSHKKVVSRNKRMAKMAADEEFELRSRAAFKNFLVLGTRDDTSAKDYLDPKKYLFIGIDKTTGKAIALNMEKEKEILEAKLYSEAEEISLLTVSEDDDELLGYERQQTDSNNCFCCAAAALYNQHLLNKRRLNPKLFSDAPLDLMTQYDVRGFTPRFKEFSDFIGNDPGFATEDTFSKYLNDKIDIDAYANPDSISMGNVYALSDLFVKLDSSVCVNNMTLHLAGLQNSEKEQMNALFLQRIRDVINSGEAVSILSGSHYRTIIGVKGNMVQVYNSMAEGENLIESLSVNELLTNNKGTVEITWLSEKTDELMQKFSGLTKSNGVYKSSNSTTESNTVGHTLGVDVEMTADDKEKDKVPEALLKLVSRSVYIPNIDSGSTTTLSEMRKDGRADAARAKAELVGPIALKIKKFSKIVDDASKAKAIIDDNYDTESAKLLEEFEKINGPLESMPDSYKPIVLNADEKKKLFEEAVKSLKTVKSNQETEDAVKSSSSEPALDVIATATANSINSDSKGLAPQGESEKEKEPVHETAAPVFASTEEQIKHDEALARRMIEKSGLAKQHELIDAATKKLKREEQAKYVGTPYRDYHGSLIADRKDPKGLYQSYEHQPSGSNNCYCCAAAALYNQHMLHKRKKALAAKQADPGIGEQLTQYDVRVYRPEFRSFQDQYKNAPKITRGHYDDYLKEMDLVSSYTSKDSHEMGNIYALSDMFVHLDPKVCTNSMTFYRSCLMNETGTAINPVAQRMMENHFLDQISSILATGEAAAMLSGGHYRTIVGINGHMLQILDSVPSSDNKLSEVSVHDLFRSDEGVVEITWLSEKDDKLKSQFSDLYQEGDELKSKSAISENDVGHTLGVDVTHTYEEKRSIPVTLRDSISHVMYVPKRDDIQKTTVEAMRAGGEHEEAKKASKNIVRVHKPVQESYQSAFDEAYKELRAGANELNARLDGAFLKRFEKKFRDEYAGRNKLDQKALTQAVFPIVLRRTADVDREYLRAVEGCEKAEKISDLSKISREDIEKMVANAIRCGHDPVGYKKEKQEREKAKEAQKKAEEEAKKKAAKDNPAKEKDDYDDMDTPEGPETKTAASSASAVLKTSKADVPAKSDEPETAVPKTADIEMAIDVTDTAAFIKLTETFENTEGRSKEFLELSRAIKGANKFISDIKEHNKFSLDEQSYAEYLRLYNAASAYCRVHEGAWHKKTQQSYKDALGIQQFLDKTAVRMLEKEKKIIAEEPVKYSIFSFAYDDAKKNVTRFMEYFDSFCKQIDNDPLATDEEKLRRKWNCIKTCERDIQIYLDRQSFFSRNKKELYDSKMVEKVNAVFYSLKDQIMLRDLAKSSGIKSVFRNETDEKIDEAYIREFEGDVIEENMSTSLNVYDGLSRHQISALSTIDTWVMRNIRNGGLFKIAGVVSDRTEIASKLFSMSRRKRMYIYYLIESRQRLNPNIDGFTFSQTQYIPNLERFKDRMVASKAKFYKRFSGGYVYWQKLNEAIRIADGNQGMIDSFNLVYAPEDVKSEATKINPQATDEVKHRQQLKRMLLNMTEISALINENEDEHIPEGKKARNRARITELTGDVLETTAYVRSIEAKFEKDKGISVGHKAQVKQYLSTFPGDVSNIGSNVGKAITIATLPEGFEAGLKDFGNSMTGLSTFGSLIGAVFNVWSIIEGRKSMSYLSMATTVADVTMTGVKVAKNITTLVQAAGESSAAVDFITSSPVGMTIGLVDAGVTIFKGISYVHDDDYRKEADKQFAEKKRRMIRQNADRDKLFEGMAVINRHVTQRESGAIIGKMVSTGITLTSSVLVAASVLTGGVSALIGIGVFAVGLGFKMYDKKKAIDMKLELFDSFYNVDSLSKDAESTWKRNHPDDELSDKVKKDIKQHIRRRLAAKMGYSSPLQAAAPIADKYAGMMLDIANSDSEDAEMYQNMIQGLGLRFYHDSVHSEKNTPQKSDIVKKLLR